MRHFVDPPPAPLIVCNYLNGPLRHSFVSIIFLSLFYISHICYILKILFTNLQQNTDDKFGIEEVFGKNHQDSEEQGQFKRMHLKTTTENVQVKNILPKKS